MACLSLYTCTYRHIRQIADEKVQEHGSLDIQAENPRDWVKCALCPSYHGGMKATTDGRWVHLCCAWWSGCAVIQDLNEMSPIDISAIPLQAQSVEEDEKNGDSKYSRRRRGSTR